MWLNPTSRLHKCWWGCGRARAHCCMDYRVARLVWKGAWMGLLERSISNSIPLYPNEWNPRSPQQPVWEGLEKLYLELLKSGSRQDILQLVRIWRWWSTQMVECNSIMKRNTWASQVAQSGNLLPYKGRELNLDFQHSLKKGGRERHLELAGHPASVSWWASEKVRRLCFKNQGDD